MAERPYTEAHCRDCQCAEHNTMSAVAERVDTWKTANTLLTEAVIDWPTGKNDEHDEPPTVDAAGVLILANWLYFGGSSVDT